MVKEEYKLNEKGLFDIISNRFVIQIKHFKFGEIMFFGLVKKI